MEDKWDTSSTYGDLHVLILKSHHALWSYGPDSAYICIKEYTSQTLSSMTCCDFDLWPMVLGFTCDMSSTYGD